MNRFYDIVEPTWSDKFFTIFIFSLLILLLVGSSGFTKSFPGLFNITNRFAGRVTTKYNDIKIYTNTRLSDNSNKRYKFKSTIFCLSVFTFISFVVFIVLEMFKI